MKYIAIPIGGVGQRFSDCGYVKPKPLSMANGESIVNRVINSIPRDEDLIILVAYTKELLSFNFETYLIKHHPKRKFLFKVLEYQTRGAAETLLCLLNSFDLDQNSSIMSIDCDTIQQTDSIQKFFSIDTEAVMYFVDDTESKLYSFINTSEDGMVIEIREKVRISNRACSGAYGFSSVRRAKELLTKVISRGLSSNEFYLSLAIHEALMVGYKVASIPTTEKLCLGTPQELQVCSLSARLMSDPKTFCVDLDGTLVSFPRIIGDYNSVEPIYKNILFLQNIKKRGHRIIIHTARGMLSCNGDVGLIEKIHYSVIEDTLKRFDIPYDEILLGKPLADFYIDDLSVNAASNLEKETGFYTDSINARSRNVVTHNEDLVTKITSNKGEVHWYNNIPSEVKHLFPRCTTIGNKLIMERIDGMSLSSLFINGSMTEVNIDRLMIDLSLIHATKAVGEAEVNIYDLYLPKLMERYCMLPKRISAISSDLMIFFVEFFTEYQKKNSAVLSVIHGDAVFTNILIDQNGTLRFIDMRGMVGNKETIYGDRNYDYAKILQSLLGYDSLLRGVHINSKYRDSLIAHFIEKCPANERDIRAIAAYLLFTLIPLHEDNALLQDQSFSLAKQVIGLI
jgi:capsule biosynthesis phosphatase